MREFEEVIVDLLEARGACTFDYLATVLPFKWWETCVYYPISYTGLKKSLGRLLIEKKIDYTREGLWAPALYKS